MANLSRTSLRDLGSLLKPKLLNRSKCWPLNLNGILAVMHSRPYSSASLPPDVSPDIRKSLKGPLGVENTTNIPLKTYNVTKVDARPKLSEHHKILFDDKKISIPWEEGKTSHFQHLWIRDHCQCPECFHPDTKQRLLNTFSIPNHVRPESVEATETGMQISWKNGHKSFFTWEWLHLHSYNPRLERYLSPQFKLWGSEITECPPEVEYESVMETEKGVAEWTRKIYIYGFCYINGVPVNPDATKALIERIAHIQHTHYGGFWSFTSDLASKDTAYTSLPLSAHTDTTYFSSPAGLQLFHLLSHTGGTGGQTLLVDGFRAAKLLRDEDPTSYRILSNTRIPAHSSGNNGISIQPYAPFPVLNHQEDDEDVSLDVGETDSLEAQSKGQGQGMERTLSNASSASAVSASSVSSASSSLSSSSATSSSHQSQGSSKAWAAATFGGLIKDPFLALVEQELSEWESVVG